jgi:hypothetical protein
LGKDKLTLSFDTSVPHFSSGADMIYFSWHFFDKNAKECCVFLLPAWIYAGQSVSIERSINERIRARKWKQTKSKNGKP